jgi:hypothetical protein
MTTMADILERARAYAPPLKRCLCGADHRRSVNICTKCLRARSMKGQRTIKTMRRARATARAAVILEPVELSTGELLRKLIDDCAPRGIG